jgi:hypothetical protein
MTNLEISYLICAILIIIFIVITSFAIITFQNNKACTASNNNYCYDDWKCLKTNDGNENGETINMSDETIGQSIDANGKPIYNKKGIRWKCKYMTKEDLDTFTYIDDAGLSQTVHPGLEPNIYAINNMKINPATGKATGKRCTYDFDTQTGDCPNYTVGSIYWGSCTGSTDSRYYQNPVQRKALANIGKERKMMRK